MNVINILLDGREMSPLQISEKDVVMDNIQWLFEKIGNFLFLM